MRGEEGGGEKGKGERREERREGEEIMFGFGFI